MTEEETQHEDRQIKCRECGDEFNFSVRDQMYFATQGFADPFRCHACRRAKKERRENPNAEVQP